MNCSCQSILFIGLLILLFILWNQSQTNIQENWTTYQSGPYGTIRSGSTPLRTYTRMLYRQPYGYPFRFFSSFPTKQAIYFPPN